MSYNPLELKGKLVLVTGASSGIGRAIAITISRLGARVVLNGRRETALSETLGEMESPAMHFTAAFDLARLDEIPGWLKQVRQRVGAPLDGVVHAAGVGGPTPLRVLSRARIEHIFVPNLFAALMLLRASTARDVGVDGASFVVISSVAGLAGAKGLSVYAASKGAVHALIKAAAQELADRRIRVNCVAPAYVQTPMYAQVKEELPGQAVETRRQPLGLITPEEVAVASSYLLSDASRRVTGTVMPIDAGFML